MAQDGAHDVHLRVAGTCVAALMVDLLEDDRSVRLAQAATAVLLGDQRAQPAVVRQPLHELGRIPLLPVQLAPVLAGKLLAQLRNAFANHGLVLLYLCHCHVGILVRNTFGEQMSTHASCGSLERMDTASA